MKILKSVGLVLLAAVLLLLIVSFFIPSQVHVERSRVVKARPDAVFAQVNELRNWNNWMPWNKIDPEMKITWGEVTQGPGATYSWQSNHKSVGNGSVTISRSDPGKLVETKLNFMENGVANGNFIFEEVSEGTKVTWTMDSDMGMNPIGKFFGLFMDDMIGPDFEKGLEDLDNVAQANPIAQPEEPIVNTPEQPQPQDSLQPSRS